MSDEQNYPTFTVKLATDNQLVGMSKRYSYNKDGSGMMQEEANELGITYNDSLQLAILAALRTYQDKASDEKKITHRHIQEIMFNDNPLKYIPTEFMQYFDDSKVDWSDSAFHRTNTKFKVLQEGKPFQFSANPHPALGE